MTDQTVSLLKLVKRKDADSSDIDSVDFLALPTELQYQGWSQGLAQKDKNSVDESITLVMNAGNANTLATSLQAIDTKIKEIGWAQDPLNPIGVWLRSQLNGETGQRQAFILSANRPTGGLKITDPLAYQNVIPNYNLGLTRMKSWENVLAQQVPANPGTVSIHGGTVAYTINGDAHARVAKTKITVPGAATTVFNDVWLGVKSGRYGVTPANFIPTWKLNLGTSYSANDTTSTADATAVSGAKSVCTFATVLTMANRVIITVNNVAAFSGTQSDQRGRYTVLLRAKTTNSSLVANIRIGQGYLINVTTPASFTWRPRFQISNAASGWLYYALGQVSIPPTGGITDLDLNSAALGLQAEKVSGTGNLEMDCLVLIPADNSIHVAPTIPSGVSSVVQLYILTRPDYRYYSVTFDAFFNAFMEAPSPDQVDWAIPSGSGVIVCAGNNSTNLVSDTFTPVFTVYPSYASLRGAA